MHAYIDAVAVYVGAEKCFHTRTPQEVNVARVVTSVMETFRALATVNKIPTRVILDPEMPSTVETDGTHLHHILSNLIGTSPPAR